jgi:hypothetical protein
MLRPYRWTLKWYMVRIIATACVQRPEKNSATMTSAPSRFDGARIGITAVKSKKNSRAFIGKTAPGDDREKLET